MRNGILLLLLLQLFACGSGKEKHPNIVVFMADDVSWNDFGCYGNVDISTPNIDLLSQEGMRFNKLFLTTSSCSPSRISIMSGRYPHNTGAPELHTEPSIKLQTIAGALKDHGYYIAQAGKWHMGNLMKLDFDRIEEEDNGPGGESNWLKVLNEREQDKPFFLWLAAHDAHRGWGENKFNGNHDPTKIKVPSHLVDNEDTRKDLANYYDEVTRFDHHIGLLKKELQDQGILDETIIVVMADNGRPFPRDKTRLYDGGLRTPFIIRYPDAIKEAGNVCDQLVSSIDLAPTLLTLAKVPIPETFQGKSFSFLLKSPSSDFRNYAFAEHNWHDHEAFERAVRTKQFLYILNAKPKLANQGPLDVINSPSFAALLAKKSEGKLSPIQQDIFQAPRASYELYDCIKDPLHLNNLYDVSSHQKTFNDLNTVLGSWMSDTADDMPTNATKDWYDRETGATIESNLNKRGQLPGASTNAVQIMESGPF